MRLNWTVVIAAGLILTTGWVQNATFAQDEHVSDRLKRQINLMEEIIDEVLIESPYLLIFGGDPTHGIYLDEFGVLFAFEASLVDKDWEWSDFPWIRNKFRIETEDGKIIIYKGDDDDDDEIVIEGDEDIEDWLKDKEAHEMKTYESGKTELIDVLTDYGETLTRLRDNHWVAIAAFLRDTEYFRSRKISRLILKAKMSDLRAHAQDRITRDELLTRIVEEEY
jgi:hypothetical protein